MVVFFENFLFNVSVILVTVTVIIIAFYKWIFSYWDRLGIETIKPSIPFGNVTQVFFGRVHIDEQLEEIYKTFKARGLKHGGLYLAFRPVYLPLDPEIVKSIMIKDFNHFINRGFAIDEKSDPLSGHLLNLEDAKWKNVRAKLSPTFSSGKIKMMFQHLCDCTVGLKKIMDKAAENHEAIDIKEILSRFTTDVIGSVAFGINCNSLEDPDAEFRRHGRQIFELSLIENLKFIVQLVFPKSFMHLIKFKFTKPDVEKFFLKMVKDTVAYREKNNVKRNDFMQLLIDMKNEGLLADDGDGKKNGMTIEELAAQVYVFFIGGFETSSTTMTFALFELATNPDCQDRVREEITSIWGDGEITYEKLGEMHYLERVVLETLRKYPLGALSRVCNQDYKVPGTDLILEKGALVFLPFPGLHHDPEFYPDPDRFDPDRFTDEVKKQFPTRIFGGFGDGPRNCIGMRFGMIQSKLGLATLLKNYKFKVAKRTIVPLQWEPTAAFLTAKGDIWLDVEKIAN